jgi:hypothetical protein
MLKLSPPGSENAIIDNYVPIFRPGEYKIRHLDDKGRFKQSEDEQVGTVVIEAKPTRSFLAIYKRVL